MSDELEKLRKSIKKTTTVLEKLKALSVSKGLVTLETPQTETEQRILKEELDRSVSPEPGS